MDPEGYEVRGTMTATYGAVIEKAKRLLTLRERASTEGEAMAAAKALTKLLEKHRLSVAEVESAEGEDQEPVEAFESPEDALIRDYARLPRWRRELVSSLARHYGVATWSSGKMTGWDSRDREQWRWTMRMCGRRSDVEMLRFMFTWLSTEAQRVAPKGLGRRYRSSWLFGFALGISAQLKDLREESQGEAAMVLQSRYDQARAKLSEKVADLEDSPKRGKPKYDKRAALSGFVRGKDQHLGKSLDEEGSEREGPSHRLLPSSSTS